MKELIRKGISPFYVTRTPKITGKGQVYFINKFLNKTETVKQ